ncbi:CPBP family intramembrane glutamic endopeptidase [Propionibacterium australiense]|uniref:CPBP family intramembrane glutamic endopeptidase n=1 Tax=Propionibacterium australiense TaxID=119981 RepID=UPI001476AEFF|nr:CPBP family intramembrane glutamic endopeptidase [Propionibacterium australiense]
MIGLKKDGFWAYLLKNLFPLAVEAVFVVLVVVGIPRTIYLNLMLYLLMILYFAARREYSFTEWWDELRKKIFWVACLGTLVLIGAGFAAMTVLQGCFADVPLGDIKLRSTTRFGLFLFAVQTIAFPPLAEEMFYRKYLISLQGGARTAVTLMVSSVLFAAAHAVYPFGILTYAVLGMSFGLAYVWHKNIYAMMSVHFIEGYAKLFL